MAGGRGARGRGADKKKRGRKGWSENERAAHEKASQRMNDAKAAREAEQAKAKEKEAKKRKNAFTNLLFGRKRNDADDSDEDDADSQNEVYPTELPGIDDDDDGACGNDGSGDVDGSDDDDDQQKMPADSASLGDDDDVGDKEPDEIMQILDHPPIVADMEDDEDDAYDLTEDVDDSGGSPPGGTASNDVPSGVSAEYLEAVYKRFQYEFTGKCKGLEVAWLIELLKKNNYVVKKDQAECVCKKLDIDYSEPYYYRDVVVWVPDEQWGIECTPCCPSCGTNDKVGVHGYRTNHFGRRIVSLTSHYFIISRRYICHGCKGERGKAEAAIAATAEREGINIEVIPSAMQTITN